jgi:hypothetical protein
MGFQLWTEWRRVLKIPANFVIRGFFLTGFTFFQFSIFFIWRIVSILAELKHILSIATGVF